MSNDQSRTPQDQKSNPQQRNPGQQNAQDDRENILDEDNPAKPQQGNSLDTGVDTGAIQPGKTQGANLA